MTSLDRLAAKVTDRSSFIAFLEDLARDRMAADLQGTAPQPFGSGARGWENGSIAAFLDAAVAWARDSDDPGPDNPRRACADILLAGKYYE